MGSHLFVVLTDVDQLTGRVVIAPIVTERTHTDKTVRLNVGDHTFIRHASNVDFGAARYANATTLAEQIKLGEASIAESIDARLLRRMQQGLLESAHTINEIAAYVRSVTQPD